ncbi:amino acid permease [Clostridium perfringens]|uniref:amino acid permease n=1 Tax=Clostridium perfringens TaxID=1502 RepID=UPI000E115C4D|nr:amino acid permease [Clostridium perfringens]MDH5086747.1 Inner membrane transporter YcaM [Clostridium perfringens]MDK0773090.1 amino acid permease [Clostridium perfringens]MDK0778282.1 amino acid permease [Clostridium perfringens]NGU52407.1 amino acid permease [Clostridium perfringens]UBK68298.1 amino acid permease [Clostridium perfringens]
MGNSNDGKKLMWYNLGLMAFVSVWGFGNVVNNFATQGLTVVTSWILIIALYFVPYALMVGELGSTFRDSKGGVSSWISKTMGPTLAYLAGWTYWVVHVPYLAQKPQAVLVSLGWAVFQDGSTIKGIDSKIIQLVCLVVFLFFVWIASRGVNSLGKIGTIAGTAMFVMSILYIVLMLTAPAITGTSIASPNMTSIKTYIPKFDFAYFTTIAMLVFSVGGAEKISPYVNNMKDSKKGFSKGMIALAIMVAVTALLGSVAMGMMFDANNVPDDLMLNGAYYAFQKLGNYYGIGNSLLILYALANFAAQVSALVFSIDAPLKVLLSDTDARYVPIALTKTNKNGAPINGYIMTSILVGILIIVPALGIGNFNALFTWLLKLNAVVMPMRYLWVFLAYIMLRKAIKGKFKSEYKFVKNDKFAMLIGTWCFVFTAFACILGMFPTDVQAFSGEWIFRVGMNIGTPLVLIGLGLILPKIAKRTNGQAYDDAVREATAKK